MSSYSAPTASTTSVLTVRGDVVPADVLAGWLRDLPPTSDVTIAPSPPMFPGWTLTARYAGPVR